MAGYTPTRNPALPGNPRASGANKPTGGTGNPRSADPALQPQPYSPQPYRYPQQPQPFGMSWGDVDLQFRQPQTAGTGAGAQPIPGDWSLQDPGAMERAWEQYGGGFFGPSSTSQFAQQYAPQLTGGGAAGNWWSSMQGQLGRGTNAQGYFGNFEKPQVSTEAGLDPYYDRQAGQAQERINRAFAARGGFGSSAATDTIADAMVGLGAEQANREADYRLRALGEQRMWEGLGGQLARGADLSNQGLMGLGTQAAMGADQSLASRLGVAGNLMQAGDAQNLAGMIAGMNAAQGAQGAREGRIRGAFNDLSGMGAAVGGSIQDALMAAIGGDTAMLEAILAAQLGIPSEQLNRSDRNAEALRGDAAATGALLGGLGPGGAGLIGGGGGIGAKPAYYGGQPTPPNSPGVANTPGGTLYTDY